MTIKTQRTEIQIETHKVTVIRTRGKQFSAYCEHCGANVTSFTANQTGELLQMTEPTVFQMVDEQKFHRVSSDMGVDQICSNSFSEKDDGLTIKDSKKT